jgi:hypothetical protein
MDISYDPGRNPVGLRRFAGDGRLVLGKYRDHADAEIEHVLHFGSGNLAGLLKETE